jgi:hypothetical protein
MFSALQSVLSVIIMIGLGFILAKRGWFEGKAPALISRLVVSVALPAYMINNLLGGYDRQGLLSMLPGLGVPFVTMISGFILASLLAVLIRIPKGRRGTFASMFSLSNSIFIGLPVNMLLFGDESLPFVLLYYIANTTCFWTIGTFGIANDGALLSSGPKPSLFSLSGLKRLLSPPLVAFIVAVLLILLEIRLPKWVMDTTRYLGNMTTPMSMLFVGIVVARVDWKKLRFGLDMLVLVAGRFVFTPLIVFLLVKGGDFPVLMKQVFVIQAAMPAMTQTPILAEAYKADSEYAGLGTSLTTLLSLVSIPVYMAFVGKMF